jgi:hypothetical protein
MVHCKDITSGDKSEMKNWRKLRKKKKLPLNQ